MEEKKIVDIVKEEVKIFEANFNGHGLRQLNNRFNVMERNGDLTSQESSKIRTNLSNVLQHSFNPKRSYGILLGSFIPNPKSRLYTTKNRFNYGIPFYEIKDRDDITKESVGDEFWIIIRNNEITTAMLRKKLQRQFTNLPRNVNGGLGVDEVIYDFNNHMKKGKNEKELMLK